MKVPIDQETVRCISLELELLDFPEVDLHTFWCLQVESKPH